MNPYQPPESEFENAAPTGRPRRGWLAALMNYFLGGLGYLYLGRVGLALLMPLLVLLWVVLAGRSGLLTSVPEGVPPLLWRYVVGNVVPLVAAVHAFALARGVRPGTPSRWQRWYWYLAYGIAVVMVLLAFSGIRGMALGVDTFNMSSSSMAPTIVAGELVVVDTTAYAEQAPERGDVVVFRYPPNPSIAYVARVVGLPGDRIEHRGGELVLGGEVVKRTRVDAGDILSRAPEGTVLFEESLGGAGFIIAVRKRRARSFEAVTVAGDEYYMLGDNRGNSHDSRYWGGVPLANIIGKARDVR